MTHDYGAVLQGEMAIFTMSCSSESCQHVRHCARYSKAWLGIKIPFQIPRPPPIMLTMKMNLRKLHDPDPDDFPLARLDDESEYQRAMELLLRLEGVHRRLQLSITRLDLRQHVELGDSDGKRGDRRKQLAHRLAAIEVELAIVPAGIESKIEIALAVGDGGELPQSRSPTEELERLHRQELALFTAVGEQREKVEAIKARISFEHAQRTRAHHQQLLLKVYRAACDFAAAIDQERAYRIDLLNRGFTWLPGEHPLPPLRAAAVLGAESDPSSELSRWRRTLEDAGVL